MSRPSSPYENPRVRRALDEHERAIVRRGTRAPLIRILPGQGGLSEGEWRKITDKAVAISLAIALGVLIFLAVIGFGTAWWVLVG